MWFCIDLSHILLDDIVMINIFTNRNLAWKKAIFFIVNLLFLVLIFLWLYFRIKVDQAIVPLHYNIYYGIDWYGPNYYLYLYPLLGLIWSFVNFGLGLFWYKHNKKLFYWLAVYSSVLNIFLTFGLFLVIIFYFN